MSASSTPTCAPSAARASARFAAVVRDGLLTYFQAEQFLQGKWKRFSIGKYKVLERLGSACLAPGEVSIRANTLEDVFIRLTGRRLRESCSAHPATAACSTKTGPI